MDRLKQYHSSSRVKATPVSSGRDIVELIKRVRKRRGITQRALAESSGILQQQYSQIERSGSIRLSSALLLLDKLGLQLAVIGKADDTATIDNSKP